MEQPSADAFYYQGLVREARGDARGATVSFLQAREADLHAEPPPWSLNQTQFERRVQAAVRRLPERLSVRIEGALVVVSDMPGPEVVAEGVDPHVGVLLDELLDASGQAAQNDQGAERAGRVFIYQRNIERWADGADQLEDEILRALEHELTLTFMEPPR
jgi:predicted Zn-dependent protease with MMP-like domain